MKLQSPGGGTPVNRIFRLTRETKIDWITLQPGVFRYAFVSGDNKRVSCVFDLWSSVVVVVTAPWPDDRGFIRRGRKNPFSRERG